MAPEKAPAKGVTVEITFEKGLPVALDGLAQLAREGVDQAALDAAGGEHDAAVGAEVARRRRAGADGALYGNLVGELCVLWGVGHP